MMLIRKARLLSTSTSRRHLTSPQQLGSSWAAPVQAEDTQQQPSQSHVCSKGRRVCAWRQTEGDFLFCALPAAPGGLLEQARGARDRQSQPVGTPPHHRLPGVLPHHRLPGNQHRVCSRRRSLQVGSVQRALHTELSCGSRRRSHHSRISRYRRLLGPAGSQSFW